MQPLRDSTSKRVLLVEPQALFAPYFVATLERSGLDVVAVVKRPDCSVLRRMAPDIVVVDAAHRPAAPLRTIRAIRAAAPEAHIVVFATNCEPAWWALARTLGADAIVGAHAQERDLVAALGS